LKEDKAYSLLSLESNLALSGQDVQGIDLGNCYERKNTIYRTVFKERLFYE